MAPDSRRSVSQFLFWIQPAPRDLDRSQPISLSPNRTPSELTVIAWLSPLFFHTSKDEVGAVSGQDALSIRHVPAFQLHDMCASALARAALAAGSDALIVGLDTLIMY